MYHKKLARIKGVDDKDPLSWKSVYIAKPNRETIYHRSRMLRVRNLEKLPDLEQYDKAGERGKKKMEEQKQLHEDMAKDSNVKELSLRDVKRQFIAYAKMGLKLLWTPWIWRSSGKH